MIEIKHLSAQSGKFKLSDIDFTIKSREYLVILGPTGAGKTVLLECIAGLRKIKEGQISVDGEEITHLAPEQRHIGYVPQDYVLFPFLNVKENIAFGLDRKKYSKTKAEDRIAEMARIFGIANLLDRDTRSLSGGEKQRVSMARALAPSSGILLLDEPLSSLDQQTANHLRLELRRIHKELGVTTIHVTHNQNEAEEMGNRIAVLHNGKLEQIDVPHEIFFSPKNETVSDFIGAPNILECDRCMPLSNGIFEAYCKGMRVLVPHDGNTINKIALFPRDIFLSDSEPPGPQINRYKGKITEVKHSGSMVHVITRVNDNYLRTEISRENYEDMDLAVNKEVYLILKLRRMRVYEDKSDR